MVRLAESDQVPQARESGPGGTSCPMRCPKLGNETSAKRKQHRQPPWRFVMPLRKLPKGFRPRHAPHNRFSDIT